MQAEYRTSNSRIDPLISTKDYTYIIQPIFGRTAQQAIKQIEHKNYALPYKTNGRYIIKIGANVSTATYKIKKQPHYKTIKNKRSTPALAEPQK